MKKMFKYLFVSLLAFLTINNVSAVTIKETVNSGDSYDTIERNTTVIGSTKFTSNEVITAGKATTAGANDATLYVKLGLSVTYKEVATIYYSTPVQVTVIELIPGDLNGDRVVDAADQALVRQAILGNATIEGADLNGDSVVDICDLVYISLLMNA